MSQETPVEIEWDSLEKLKRNDLQRLCKELKLNIKGTSKNSDLIDALLNYKNTLSNTNNNNDNNNNSKNINVEQKETQPKIVNIVDNKPPKKNQQETNEMNVDKEQEQEMKEIENHGEHEEQEEQKKQEQKEQEEQEEQEKNESQINIDTHNNNNNHSNNDINNEENDNGNNEEEMIGLKFRNYIPKEPTLLKYRVEKATVPPIADELMSRLKVLETNPDIQISFIPKKVNWDLKRDCSKKLMKLEKQTEKAIYQLIKQKLGKEEINESNVYLLSKTMDKINSH
ncbi:hypothetical protein DICPUDRAFT_96005 [Dictyostelium purpureum]|uniref:Uncharacterized protein n=1 Tax=Dictyostelium purpureum TaxID=5786 RepID=F1A3P7_DICPU|nr:uncharacterized protein DICPUDRAFT_96005 [Dictyostelium purpureum]EGC29185.1 hypothetical protein DICPUDRAFT_96005 [Dictyostelium purpureum]|eukprot:XP_003294293.1 hypothetical protein DICPUDRAFT_96005 [Dictyostelium purpureum]